MPSLSFAGSEGLGASEDPTAFSVAPPTGLRIEGFVRTFAGGTDPARGAEAARGSGVLCAPGSSSGSARSTCDGGIDPGGSRVACCCGIADPGGTAFASGLLGRKHVDDVRAKRDLVPLRQPDFDADLAEHRRRFIGRDEHAALTDIGRVQLRELGPALALDEERVIRWMALALTPLIRHRN